MLADLCNRITFSKSSGVRRRKPPLSTGRLRFWRTRRRIQTQGTISFSRRSEPTASMQAWRQREKATFSLSLSSNDSNSKRALGTRAWERPRTRTAHRAPQGKIASYFGGSPMSPISVTGSNVHSEMVVVQLVNSPQRMLELWLSGKQWPWGCQGWESPLPGCAAPRPGPGVQFKPAELAGGGAAAARTRRGSGTSLPYLLLKLLCSNSAPSPLVWRSARGRQASAAPIGCGARGAAVLIIIFQPRCRGAPLTARQARGERD